MARAFIDSPSGNRRVPFLRRPPSLRSFHQMFQNHHLGPQNQLPGLRLWKANLLLEEGLGGGSAVRQVGPVRLHGEGESEAVSVAILQVHRSPGRHQTALAQDRDALAEDVCS